MPRSAATILGLILVACSIGFNTARYPVVWEMADPARATKSVQPNDAVQPENADSPTPTAPLEAASASSQPIQMQPASEIAGEIVADELALHRDSPATGETADDVHDAVVGIESRKPLVPVTSVGLTSGLRSTVPADAGIRRLPPVERTSPERNLARSSNGAIPIYPSTGIE